MRHHTISKEDLKDFVNESIIASSSAERKRLIVKVMAVENKVWYTVEHDKEVFDFDIFVEAIDKYNSIGE